MKIYRRSIFRSYVMYVWLFFLIIFILFFELTLRLYWPDIHWVLYCLLGVLLAGLLLIPLSDSYIILADDRLIIRNILYPFWGRRCRYEDITAVEIRSWYTARAGVYESLQVFTASKNTHRYAIRLVDARDYGDIIKKLKEIGV